MEQSAGECKRAVASRRSQSWRREPPPRTRRLTTLVPERSSRSPAHVGCLSIENTERGELATDYWPPATEFLKQAWIMRVPGIDRDLLVGMAAGIPARRHA